MATISNEMLYDGIEVNAIGPYGNYSSKTDNNGNFSIKNVPNGTYRIEYSKGGYGTMKSFGVQIFGNDTITKSSVTLYKMPLKLIVPPKPAIIRYPAIEELDVNDVVFQLSENNNYIAFIDIHETVSSLNYQLMLRLEEVYHNNSQINQYKKFNFRSINYKSGTKIYLIIYSYNPLDQGYLDPILGIMIFPTVNPDSHSNVINLTMP